MQHLYPEKPQKIFNSSQFTATEDDSAQDKMRFANTLAAFILSEFSKEKWIPYLYKRLHNLYGHIAHMNKEGFYRAWFSDICQQYDWLEYIVTTIPNRCDPSQCWSDVENTFREWIIQSNLIEKYRALCAEETRKREIAQLRVLQAKYPEIMGEETK